MRKILLGAVSAGLTVAGAFAAVPTATAVGGTTIPTPTASAYQPACDAVSVGSGGLHLQYVGNTTWHLVQNGVDTVQTVTLADDDVDFPGGFTGTAYVTADAGYQFAEGSTTSYVLTVANEHAVTDCDDAARWNTDTATGTSDPATIVADADTTVAGEVADTTTVPELATGDNATRASTCENKRKSMTATRYQTASDGAALTGNGTDTHRVRFKFWINYQLCDSSNPGQAGDKVVYVLSADWRVAQAHNCEKDANGVWMCDYYPGSGATIGYTNTTRCDGIQNFKMNLNQIGQWNPTTRTFTCDGTKSVWTDHAALATQTAIYASNPASERCIGSDLKISLSGASDWNGYSKSICLI